MIGRSCFALLVVGFAMRWSAGEFMIHRGVDRLPDSELYLKYATTIDEGTRFEVGGDRARRTPGYPLFIVIGWRLFGHSDRGVLFLQALVSTGTAFAVYRISRHGESLGLAGGTAGFALTFAVFDPYAIVLSGMILSETTAALLLTLTGWCGLSSCTSGGRWSSRFMGVFGALAILVRPSALVLFVLGSAWLWWFTVDRLRARGSAIRCLTWFAIVMAPWWARNFADQGTFVATTLNVGESLYDGVGPQATGGSDMAFTRAMEVAGIGEIERDRHWLRMAWQQLRAQPSRVARLIPVKLGRYFSPWPNEANFRQTWLVLATTLGTVPVWCLALVGAWRIRSRLSLLCLLLGPLLYFAMLHAVFVSSVRYRVPAMPFVCVLAGSGCASLALNRGNASRNSKEVPVEKSR